MSFHPIWLWEKAKELAKGVEHLTDWLGSGGTVVATATAQHRANTCITCGLNKPGAAVTEAVARAVRGQLGIKNHLKLRVEGEKKLHTCQACGCVLRLLIWEPQERVEAHIPDEERKKLPGMCWKISTK